MKSENWATAGIAMRKEDYIRVQEAANKMGISAGGLLFAILHEQTAGFKHFTLHKPMPRGVVVRPNVATDEAAEIGE